MFSVTQSTALGCAFQVNNVPLIAKKLEFAFTSLQKLMITNRLLVNIRRDINKNT